MLPVGKSFRIKIDGRFWLLLLQRAGGGQLTQLKGEDSVGVHVCWCGHARASHAGSFTIEIFIWIVN